MTAPGELAPVGELSDEAFPAAADAAPPPASRRGPRLSPAWLAVVAVVLVALASSATSLANGFAYDDRWIIVRNTRLHDPARWWKLFGESYWPILSQGLYRPFTSLGYMLQWWAAGGKPWLFHVVNVAVYTAGCVAALRLYGRTIPWKWALAAAALFAAHPVHVEAVGNVVGQSELWCALLLVVGTDRYVAWRNAGLLGADARHPAWGRLALLALVYVAASLFKEQGIVLPGLLVAAELTVVREPRGRRARVAAVRPAVLLMAILTVGILAVRIRILGEFSGDVPHPTLEELTPAQRLVGMLGLVPEVMRLLLVPGGLSADYGPSHTVFRTGFGIEAAQGLLILALIAIVTAAAWRRAPAVAFGVLWAAVTYAPVSNVVFPSGILIAERTLLSPSLGAVLAVVALIEWGWRAGKVQPRAMRLVGAAAAVLLVAGIVRSADRQQVWKSNDTIFRQMVEDAPLSARAHHAWGGHLFERGRNVEAEREWRLGIALDTATMRLRADLADVYARSNLCTPAVRLYEEVLERKPTATRSRVGLALCLDKMGERNRALHLVYAGFGVTNDRAAYAALRQGLAQLRAPRPRPAASAPGAAR